MDKVTVRQIFEAMPQYTNAAAIRGVDKTIQWEITGEEAGLYFLVVKDGTATMHEGRAPAANATIVVSGEVWKRIVTGQESGAAAFMLGKFKASGEIPLLMTMQNWFTLPR